MIFFGRDWREGGYEEIDNFSPWCQAWEFLRRKPSYQLDCKVVMSFYSWRRQLDKWDFELELNEAKEGSVYVNDRVIDEELKKDASIDLVNAIRELSSEDIVNLMRESPNFLIARRHGLNTEEEGMPLLPEEEISREWQPFLFPGVIGGDVTFAYHPWQDVNMKIPARHAAVIVDLRSPVVAQLNRAVLELQEEREELLNNYPSHPLYGKSDRLSFDGKIIKKSNRQSHKISEFVRVLDAKTEQKINNDITELDIYQYLDPDGYNKDDSESNNVEKRANNHVNNLLKGAIPYREYRYNELYATQMKSLKLKYGEAGGKIGRIGVGSDVK